MASRTSCRQRKPKDRKGQSDEPMLSAYNEARTLRAIRQLPLVRALDNDLWQSMVPHIETVRLETDELLFQAGEFSDQLYLIIEGEIGLFLQHRLSDASYHLETRAKGDTAGDFSVLNGVAHLVTARALKPTRVASFPRKAFDLLVNVNPDILTHVYETSADLSHRTLLARVYLSLFGDVPLDTMQSLLESTDVSNYEPGEVLYEKGDAIDGLHIVVSGRVHIEAPDVEDNPRLIAEIGANDSVDESAIIDDAPRSTRAYTTRQSIIALLSREKFHELIMSNANLLASLTRMMARRQHLSVHEASVTSEDQNFVIVPLDRKLPLRRFTQQLKLELTRKYNPLILDKSSFETLYGYSNASRTPFDNVSNSSIVGWMDDRESNHSHVLYVADTSWTHWTARCIKRADRVILLANAESGANTELREIEQQLESLYEAAHYAPRVELVLLHPSDTDRPANTMPWLKPRNLDAFHHIRNGDTGHIARLARRLTGSAQGLVLSGGGARGFVHLGVQKAIEEAGVAIDYIGGSSMGALLGGAMAQGLDNRAIYQLCRKFANPRALFDYTLPLSALMKSRKLTRFCHEVYRDYRIEDLWIPYFCVSSNLTNGKQVVHQDGYLWKAIRTSISLPGIFAPVPTVEGQLLIDGAILNTFPVDIMEDRLCGGVLIGSNASQIDEIREFYNYGNHLSGWRAFFNNINPFTPRTRYPKIAETLLRATDIKGVEQLNHTRQLLDVLIEPDIRHIPLLSFRSYEKISNLGYQEAQTEFHNSTLLARSRRNGTD